MVDGKWETRDGGERRHLGGIQRPAGMPAFRGDRALIVHELELQGWICKNFLVEAAVHHDDDVIRAAIRT